MRRVLAVVQVVVLALLALPALATPRPDLRIGVMTMQPGEVFWERFGHDAIVINDPAKGEAISYNFGFFNPEEPGFIGRFIRGEMLYSLVPLPLREDLQTYRDEGRGVSIQWLNLTPAQADALQSALELNALPQNSRYHYDYFRDNCTTRVRDVLDRALGGQLRRQLEGSSNGETFRSEATRLASPAPWMRYGFELGLGPSSDVPLTHWDDAFLPQRLADSLATANNNGLPLVSATEQLLPHRLAPAPEEASLPLWPFLLAGLGLAALILAFGRKHPRLLAALALPLWLLCGTFGAVSLYAWIGTAHWVAAANHNLWLLNPLALLMAWPALQWLRGRDSAFGRNLLLLLAILAFCGLMVSWLGPLQRNAPWVALLVPIHWALATAWPSRTLVRSRD
ncbi:MAG: DUF4105 domain-containing protein [Proteobacteria bacterium]|nr:DUF4105 domain-containing protein [Pseudomonadota bacterium]